MKLNIRGQPREEEKRRELDVALTYNTDGSIGVTLIQGNFATDVLTLKVNGLGNLVFSRNPLNPSDVVRLPVSVSDSPYVIHETSHKANRGQV